jgi:ABC-type transport system involved in multi-copper enzyme maturation permease subunit
MKTFSITLKNEWIRMTHRKKLLAGVVVAILIPVLLVVAKVLALGWQTTLIYRDDLFRLALSLFTPLILPLFSAALAADAFIDEQSKGSLKTTVLLPDSRVGHFCAKIIIGFAGAAVMMLALWLASLLAGFVLPSRGSWIGVLAIGLLQGLASLLPIIVVLGFSVLASQFMKSGSGMILALIGLALIMKLSPLWLGDLSSMIPTVWLGFGANVHYLSLGSLLTVLWGILLWSVFTYGLAFMRFRLKRI